MRIEINIPKTMRRLSRKVRIPRSHPHGTKRGARGYTRKRKHKARGIDRP